MIKESEGLIDMKREIKQETGKKVYAEIRMILFLTLASAIIAFNLRSFVREVSAVLPY